MDAALATRIERHVDQAAAALLAAACAYPVSVSFGQSYSSATALALSCAVAAVVFVGGLRSLEAVEPRRARAKLSMFDIRALELDELPELLLTERYEPPAEETEPPLILDDVLQALEPDSRVVRLFDPAAIPTAGQLNERIEHHLGATRRREPPNSPDASQALHDALAELRRSLR